MIIGILVDQSQNSDEDCAAKGVRNILLLEPIPSYCMVKHQKALVTRPYTEGMLCCRPLVQNK